MRRVDEHPIDPQIAASLDAIDATLAGDPVDPQYAELAEVALLLAGDRPQVEPAFARSLDERVARRFVRAGEDRAVRGPARTTSRGLWGWLAAGGATATAVAAAVVLVLVVSNGSTGSSAGVSSTASAPAGGGPIRATSGTAKAGGSASSAAAKGAPSAAPATGSSGTTAQSVPPATQPSSGAGSAVVAVQPPANGRKIVQSAQLQLSAPPNRVDAASQELFNVIGSEQGIVEHSSVTQTGGLDGYASFQLSIPSASLGDTMAKLSQLPFSHVASRTDSTQDVNNQFNAATSRLADDRALRTSLLKQLANAITTEQVNSLQAQIHDAEAAISSDQAALRSLNHQIAFSEVSVTINAVPVQPVARAHGSSGFTIGKGAHDAGRVLTVMAGVALIALAALVPVALVGALGLWIGMALRRRRREQALDLA
jgi:Domain of unknown function (DUF4349)